MEAVSSCFYIQHLGFLNVEKYVYNWTRLGRPDIPVCAPHMPFKKIK